MYLLQLLSLIALATASPPSVLSPPSSPTTESLLLSCLIHYKLTPITSASPNYPSLIQPLNLRTPYYPLALLRATNKHDVAIAVRCASRAGINVAARSGGHSYTGFSLGGKNGSLVIDMGERDSVEWLQSGGKKRAKEGLVKVGAGIKLGSLATKLAEKGRGIPHGVCPSVGLGGHATHGGFGFTSRMWGVTLDAIEEVEVVTADGKIRTANKNENPDLFWAIRGAGSSFGIVTSFTLQTHPHPETGVIFNYTFPGALTAESRAEILVNWQQFAITAPSKMALRAFMLIEAANPQNPSLNFVLSGAFWGPLKEFRRAITPLLRLLPEDRVETVLETNYLSALREIAAGEDLLPATPPPNNLPPASTFYTKSLTVPSPLRNSTIHSFADFVFGLEANTPDIFGTGQGTPVAWYVIIDLYGGHHSAITSPRSSTSYNSRSFFTLQLFSIPLPLSPSPPYPASGYSFMDRMVASITESQKETEFGAYLNYVDDRYSPSEAWGLYWGGKYERLREVKKKWDRGNIFWNPLGVRVEREKVD